MRTAALATALLLFLTSPLRAEKPDLARSIDARSDQAWQAALDIWNWAEPGYQEHKSAARLADLLAAAGFRVERGVANIPTAFTATYGSGSPVIGILGEYDALPGLSQQAVPQRAPRDEGNGYGHACGHHLFGVASAEAAIAVAERIKAGEIAGTVRFYGCPAEEGGAGKVFMATAGLFNDCDAVLHWHPSARNSAGDPTCLSRIGVKFRFQGHPAHAGGSPEQGRSALDAVELTAHASELLREHTPNLTRIHHVITAGGDAPNVVPEFAEVYYYVRHPDPEVVRDLYRRLKLCAEAGALATETRLETEYLGGTLPILPNETLAKITLANLRALNDLAYNDDQRAFAARLAATLDKPPAVDSIREVTDASGTTKEGSTDVGDVSWIVPTTGFSTACWVPGTPGHSWQAVAAGGTTIGRQGMTLAAKVLAATAWDLFHDPQALKAAQAELKTRLGEKKYTPLVEPNQKPPLNYRNRPRAAGQ